MTEAPPAPPGPPGDVPAALLDVVLVEGQQATLQYLSANDRGHWRTREPRRKYWLDLVQTRIRQHRIPRIEVPGRVLVVVTFSWPDHRRRDVGNLQPTAKVILDGVVRAEILADDSDRYVVGPDCRRAHGPHAVRLTITPEPR